jgi:hypothetical protein
MFYSCQDLRTFEHLNVVMTLFIVQAPLAEGPAGQRRWIFGFLTLGLRSKKTSYFYGTGYIFYPYF